MNEVKSHTDLNQSKKLAEILKVETADMCFINDGTAIKIDANSYVICTQMQGNYIEAIPCWSLAALLSVLPFHIIANNQGYAFSMHKGLNKDGETYMVRYNVFNTDVCLYKTEYYNNPIDACYEMIIKLHELKKL